MRLKERERDRERGRKDQVYTFYEMGEEKKRENQLMRQREREENTPDEMLPHRNKVIVVKLI